MQKHPAFQKEYDLVVTIASISTVEMNEAGEVLNKYFID
jgi:hypothetical protein